MKTIEEVFTFNLRKYRGKRTQADIAEAAGIPLRSYQRAEHGDIPQGPNRQAIAKALGLRSETELYADPEAPTEPTPQKALEILSQALEAQDARIRELESRNIPADPLLARVAALGPIGRRRLEKTLDVYEEADEDEAKSRIERGK